MDLKRKIYKTEIDNVPISLEFSELAHKANAAVLGRYGETAVLVAAVMNNKDKAGDFFPLTVDYEERFYAAGKIIGSRFVRREGRPSDDATLSGRLIDRTIRPLFDQRLRREVQVTVTVLAYDGKNDPDVIALLAASAALACSDVPWNGPVAGVRKTSQKPEGEIIYDSFFAGSADRINMIEFEGVEIVENEVLKLFSSAHKDIKHLIDFQKDVIAEIGRLKAEALFTEADQRIKKLVSDFVNDSLDKAVSEKTLGDLKTGLMKHLVELGESEETFQAADMIFENIIDEHVHNQVLKEGKRPDGRKFDELRELHAETGIFERTHGSGLFIRGDTQILAVTTLAPLSAGQLIETMELTGKKHFMLHYNFPNFSTGETGRSRGPGRREIGHGALAAKAIKAVLPSKDDFPYTIRVVAETLCSNGSSSMASACSASLSLMDAGVPLKKHVAGIAMGLMLNHSSGEYKILTDIQGPEDHHGDMDLKVAGTEDGITAVQMDVKIDGITDEIFELALRQARKARLEILELMKKTIAAPRPQVSPYAPTIITLEINTEKIGEVIGPGGKVINGIIGAVGNDVTIDIEQSGKVFVAGINIDSVKKAVAMVNQIVREYKVGEIVEGPVIKILDFGVIVDLGAGRDGMIHISELSDDFVKRIEDVVKLGDMVQAKVIRSENGKIGLSRKGLK